MVNPLETRPKRVALVALGPSFHDFIRESIGRKGQRVSFDEIWTVNRGMFAIQHDKVFLMDNLRWVEQHDMDYAEGIKRHNKPVITCTKYPEYPTAVEYPLGQVMRRIGDDLLNNTVAYAIAYAMSTGVEELSIYGADFFYPDVQMREEGSQACAYLLGMARSFNMRFRLPQSTSMLCAHTIKLDPQTGQACRPLYGYHRTQELKDLPVHPFVKRLEQLRKESHDGAFPLAGGTVTEEPHGSIDSPRVWNDSGNGGQAAPLAEDGALSSAVLRRGSADVREGRDGAFGGREEGPQEGSSELVRSGSPQGGPGGSRGNGLEQGPHEAGHLPGGQTGSYRVNQRGEVELTPDDGSI